MYELAAFYFALFSSHREVLQILVNRTVPIKFKGRPYWLIKH